MSGRVVIENNTGHSIRAAGCLSLFQVALTSSTYKPDMMWLTCLQRFTIPVGTSSYPVKVIASYNQCGEQPAQKRCQADGPPPLPPGTYHAVLFQSSHLVPVPPAIAVRVTSPYRVGTSFTAVRGS